MNNNIKTRSVTRAIFAFGSMFGFIWMGFHIIRDGSTMALIIGYSNIIFFSGLLLFAAAKAIHNLKKTLLK
jgi:hypothetical protein